MLQRQLLERTLRVQCACGAILLATTAAADDAAPPRLDDSAVSFTEAEDVVPMRIRAAVQRANGEPVEGALVITSAGGRGVTGANGFVEFEVNVPSDADELHITAAMTNPQTGENLLGSTRVLGLRRAAGDCDDDIRDIRDLDAGPIVLHANTECQPEWLPTFGGQPGVNDVVSAIAVFDDGDGPALFIGGGFKAGGGLKADHILRWDGTLNGWASVGSGVNAGVAELIVYDDGSGSGPALYAGGQFTVAGAVEAKRIAKWDGQAWSPLGSGIDGGPGSVSVRAMAVFDDESGAGPALFVGGIFETAGGVESKGIAKWNGESWTPIGGLGASVTVNTLTVFDDGSGGGPALYAGGWFMPNVLNHVAKLVSGSQGYAWAALGSGVSAHVYAMAVHDDGGGGGPALYVGGAFTFAGGSSASRIARWDGSSWSALGQGMNSIVLDLVSFDDGSGCGAALYAGGNFTTAGDAPASRFAAWDGASWSQAGGGVGGAVQAFAVAHDGPVAGPVLFVGGGFQTVGDIGAKSIAGWSGPSGQWQALGNGLNGAVTALQVFNDGDGNALYAGGEFTFAGPHPVSTVVKWNDETSAWESLGDVGEPAVSSLLVHDDGSGAGERLYAGRYSAGVAQWDPSLEQWVMLNKGPVAKTLSLASFDDRGGIALYVGGYFPAVNGMIANNIVKWDGEMWSTLGGGLELIDTGPGYAPQVAAMAVYNDGSGSALFVAGRFDHAGGEYANRIAKWDGKQWSQVGGGVDPYYPVGDIEALAVYDDGTGEVLVAGGTFTKIGGVEASRIAKWDGKEWAPLGAGFNHDVYALVAVDHGGGGQTLYAGGTFTSADEVAANRVAKWDGASWSPLAQGIEVGQVHALAAGESTDDSSTAVFVGGLILISPAGDSYIAKWRHCPPPKPPLGDLNGDGSVGVADLLMLLSMWGPCDECPAPAGSCPADLDSDCAVGLDDLLILLANWG